TGVVHVADLRALHDLPAPGADGVRQGVHEVTGVDVARAVQADGRADLVRQGGLDAAGLVTVEHVELHALAGRVDVLQFLQQDLALLGRAVGREEGLGVEGAGLDTAVGQQVEAGQRQVVDGDECAHRAQPPGGGAVAGEAGEELQQARAGAGRDVDRGGRAEHRAHAVGEDGGFRQRRGQAGRQPPGVAPGRPGGDAVTVVHGDLDAPLLKEPGGGQTDHAGADDGDTARTVVCGRGRAGHAEPLLTYCKDKKKGGRTTMVGPPGDVVFVPGGQERGDRWCSEHHPPAPQCVHDPFRTARSRGVAGMIAVTDLVDSLGSGFLRTVVAAGNAQVHDVSLAEPGDAGGRPGELVLGVGVTDAADALALLERAAAAQAAGVVLKGPVAGDTKVARAARRAAGPALVELRPHTSWAHVVWLLRGVLDHASAPGAGAFGASGPHNDLFALADKAAEIIDAPVTVEDAQSRVLAYSARQDTTDPARVSTIVGRRVPPETLTHFRASGVFRRLARSADPVWTPAGP